MMEFVRVADPPDLGQLYRYEMYHSADTYYDEWGKQWFSVIRLDLMTFKILKKTPCGVWIGDHWDKRFVLLTAKKRYACPSKEEALISFIARKTRQRDHLERELSDINEALVQAKKLKEKMDGAVEEKPRDEKSLGGPEEAGPAQEAGA